MPSCRAAETDTEEYSEITEAEINAQPLITDYMGQFEHDQQWNEDSMGDTGEVFGEYTPFNWVEFSEDPEHVCKHEFFRKFNAPMKQVHDFFMDWKNIPPAFDLIDTVRYRT
jgi:hypothetical protein